MLWLSVIRGRHFYRVVAAMTLKAKLMHGYYHDLPSLFIYDHCIYPLFKTCILIHHFPRTYLILDKGPKRDFSTVKKNKKDKGKRESDDDSRKTTSLRIGSSSKKGRSAEMNMQRGSLKRKDKTRDKEKKEANALERRKVVLPE
jgi:hypothetical protein